MLALCENISLLKLLLMAVAVLLKTFEGNFISFEVNFILTCKFLTIKILKRYFTS